MASFYQSAATGSQTTRSRRGGLRVSAAVIAAFIVQPSLAQSLPLRVAAQLASEHAPMVNTSTLLAFAFHESRLHPFAIHDNVTGQSAFPSSAAEAVALARTHLADGHSLDLGIMQVNSANLARTGLTVSTAFNAGESMRAGALILTAAYRQCLHGNDSPNGVGQQAALRCAASIYNTGNDQAGILNGYQADVWRAAAQIVPAIQLSGAGALPSPPGPGTPPGDVVTPQPRHPPPSLEDALHATPPVPDSGDGLNDALHLTKRKDTP
jgi:type IV secretion system protein VirB1